MLLIVWWASGTAGTSCSRLSLLRGEAEWTLKGPDHDTREVWIGSSEICLQTCSINKEALGTLKKMLANRYSFWLPIASAVPKILHLERLTCFNLVLTLLCLPLWTSHCVRAWTTSKLMADFLSAQCTLKSYASWSVRCGQYGPSDLLHTHLPQCLPEYPAVENLPGTFAEWRKDY